MTYTPDIRRYQQLVYGGETRAFDCDPWCGAIITDAQTKGAIKLSGRDVRLASDEPTPDPESPGLNVDQVDTAIWHMTHGKVNLDTRHMLNARSEFRSLVVDGRWASVSVLRAVLVDRGYGGNNRFRGRHQITVHARDLDNAPVIFDPLIPYGVPSTWDAVLDAAQAVLPSRVILTSFTRDLTPDYAVHIHPRPPFKQVEFVRYILDDAGKITHRERHTSGGFNATCTPPKWHSGSNGIAGRRLVQLTSGSRTGYWISANWSKEIIP